MNGNELTVGAGLPPGPTEVGAELPPGPTAHPPTVGTRKLGGHANGGHGNGGHPARGETLTGQALALALDATAHGERVVALVRSVLYRGCAIPVAWHILPANQPGAWLPPILALVQQLQPAVPPTLRVLLLADRGLWSPRLWQQLRQVGWHPVIRLQNTRSFQPCGQARRPARTLVPGPG